MRASIASLSKKLISTFFAATLVMGLVPTAALAVEDTGAPAPENSEFAEANSDIQAEAEASAYETNPEDIDFDVISSEGEKSALIEPNEGEALTNSSGEDEAADNATGSDNSITIPAATERINEDVMLTTPVAQQETTRTYFLAQTLESTRTVPIVTAQLPLDKGLNDVEVVEPSAEGEGSNTTEEDGEDSDDPDVADDYSATSDDSASDVISTEASDGERSGEISTPVAAASTVIGSFTYRGITYAVEPGGETVAIVAADYLKLPEDFIEAKAIVLPSMVTADGIDYYTVTRIADYAFSSLSSNEADIDAITVPASVVEIGDNAYADFNTLQYILVSEDNQQYSQYDGCLYTADQSRLLLIPEGRLGAVRVAPSVTEVSPEAFSHCPSVDTLVADPDSAAYQLLEGMGDVKNKMIVEASETATGFSLVDLGEIECSKGDEISSIRAFLGERRDSENVSIAFAGDGIETQSDCLDAFARDKDYCAMISIKLKNDSAMAVDMSERLLDDSYDLSNAYNASYTNYNSLPTWIKNVLGSSFNKTNNPSFELYGASSYSSNSSNLTTVTCNLYVRSYGRYSLTQYDLTSQPALGSTATAGVSYNAAADIKYMNATANNDKYLRYKTGYGIGAYAHSVFKPLLRVSTSTASSGTAIACRYGLGIKYDAATKMYDFSSSKKMHIMLLPPEFKVNWDANGGSVSPSSWLVQANETLSTYSTTPPTPTRTGYTFKGWNAKQDGSGTNISDNFSSTRIDNEGYTYYAQWERDAYTVKYYNKAGTSLLKTDTVYVGDSYSLWGSPTASTGYTAKGWHTSTNQIAAASGYAFNTSKANWKNKGETLTLYLAEAANTYYVDYYGNGNTGGSTARSTHTYGTSSQLRANGYTKTGHYFAGWATSSSGSVAYSNQASVSTLTSTANGVYNLYAKWNPNVCTVKYNANGGTGTMADTTHTYGTASTLRANGFTAPNGKYFNGWKTADGTAYSASQNMTYHGLAHNATITLYAQWAYTNYAVTYNANGGTLPNGTANPTYYNIDTPTFKLATPTRTGFSFQGWKTASNLSGNAVTQVTKGSTTNYTLYADWGVTFNWHYYDGQLDHSVTRAGLGSSTAYTSVSDTAPSSLTTSYLVPAGWTLHQWSRSSTGDSFNVDLGKAAYAYSNTNANNYYAKYKAEIKQNLNYGGAAATYLTTLYGYGKNPTATYKPTDPAARTGWTFDGWNVEYPSTALANDYSKYKNSNITFKGAATIVAQWSANSYNVRYNPNGGKGTMAASVHTYDIAKNLTKNAFTRDGYTYSGWNTLADGKGTAYKDEQEVKNLASAAGANLDLYAQWDANDYKVRFDPNGGSGGITGPIDVTFDSDMPALEGDDWKPTNPGYEFSGWWDTAEKTGPTQYYAADGTSAQAWDKPNDATLYARWSRMPFHAITLKDARLKTTDKSIWYWPSHGFTPSDPNEFPTNGTRDDEIVLVDKDNKITESITFDDGYDYEFLGWFDKKQGEEGAVKKIDADGTLLTDEVITEATTWYAHWERHGATVVLKSAYGEDMVVKDITEGTKEIKHVAFGKDFATLLDGGTVAKIAQTPTRVGYTFMGYYTEENPELSTDDVKEGNIKGTRWIYGEGEEGVSAGTLVGNEWPSEADWNKLGLNDDEDSNTIVLYAAWQLDDCIVEFNTEDNLKDDTERVYVPEGSTALENRIWHYNKNIDDKLPVPGDATFSRNGYTFGGWYYLDENEEEVRVSDAEGAPSDVLLPWKSDVEKVTLYAYWAPKTYALEFHPAFPGDEGVAQIYEGETSIKGIKYDDSLTLVSPDFGAYDFAGWYVGVPDGAGGWEAGSVPFSDWILRDETEVKGVHTTDVTKVDDNTYKGRFTPHDPLVGQTYDENAVEPAIIHVVARWDKPIPRTMRFYAGVPGESVEASKIPAIEETYAFAWAYDFPSTWLPDYGKDGWKCKGWIEVGSKEAAMELLKNGDQEPEDYAGVTGIEAKVTREDYRDLYFVAKWTICPLSVTLESEGDDDAYRVLATDGFLDEVRGGDARSWYEVSKRQDGDERICTAVYDVRATPFTLPDLARRGYDFKGWKRKGSEADPVKRLVVDPAVQAQREEDYDWVFEPVFEEITYRIVLKPNGGGLEEQTHERTYTQDFTFYCPVALYSGSVFSSWATKQWEPLDPANDDGTFRKFHDGMTVPLAPATGDNGEHAFGLTDLIDDGIEHVDDAPRTIILYGIWFDRMIKVDVPLTVNMAIDTETGDVVAAKTPLKPKKGNEDVVYTVESLHYESVSDERGVPFEGANEVYFSIYPDLKFKNSDDAYYFLQKNKVGEKGTVTYTSNDGEKTASPILVKLGNRTSPSLLFTRTSLPDDYALDNMAFGDTTLDVASGFRPFSADDPLDVYYGIHFGDSATWKSTLQKFAFQENADHWTLPRNDAGYQRYTGLPDDEGRRLGWSSDRVDIAKVRYTLSMKAKTTTPNE